jgi:hypothetical protein
MDKIHFEKNAVTPEIIIGMAEAAHRMAVDKEWWKRRPDGTVDFASRNLKQLIILAASELAEALEICREPDALLTEVWYRDDGKPEGFPIEIADFVIRLGDTLAASKSFDSVQVRKKENLPVFAETDVFSMLHDLNRYLFSGIYIFQSLCDAVVASFILADRCRFDLWQAIDIKRAYNAKREARHGGKVA